MAGKQVLQWDESLDIFISELHVCMLASRAFPHWSSEQHKVLIRNQFIQGVLSSSIQVQLIKKMPTTDQDVVALACRLEAMEVTQA